VVFVCLLSLFQCSNLFSIFLNVQKIETVQQVIFVSSLFLQIASNKRNKIIWIIYVEKCVCSLKKPKWGKPGKNLLYSKMIFQCIKVLKVCFIVLIILSWLKDVVIVNETKLNGLFLQGTDLYAKLHLLMLNCILSANVPNPSIANLK